MTTDTPRTDVWECFSDPSYYDMARLRRTDGPKDFNTGYHLNNLREAVEVKDILNELERRAEKAEAEVERLQRLRPTRDDVKELERELTKVTKERNDSTQAYIVLDASYKILRDSNRQLQKAIESI